MCGIVGYIGNKNAYPILLKGLKRLAYRGYDSAGVALFQDKKISVFKKRGNVNELETFCLNKNVSGNAGMGHTRWATHGEPNDVNAHPHTSMNGLFTLIHNGIIENYDQLREGLTAKNYTFYGQTDTEVLANLIEYIYQKKESDAETAVREALSKVVGAYGIVVMCSKEPDKLIAARKSSPLVIGVGEGEFYLASDATPMIEYTRSFVYLNDNDMAILSPHCFMLKTMEDGNLRVPDIQELELSVEELEKKGFDHFMLKEIFEEPRTIGDSFKGRITPCGDDVVLGGLADVMPRIVGSRRIIMIGCGTSWHSAMVGEYIIEELARIPVEVEVASEFRYRNPVIESGDVVIAVSQSGETADTLAAIRLAKESGALVLGVCNVVGSSISRETDAGIYTHAGIEIGVASTKAFSAQLTVFILLALKLAKERHTITGERFSALISELKQVPEKIERILMWYPHIQEMANKYRECSNVLYIGRGYLFPVALEGALKLKEISYIHAEGYAAGEMKHGPIALIDDGVPVVVVAAQDQYYQKIVSNVQEVKARKGTIVSVISEGDEQLKSVSDDVLEIPVSDNIITPLLAVVPLQLFAYCVAVLRKCNIDQPRNLAKSVTVEQPKYNSSLS